MNDKSVIRDGHESYVRPGQELSSPESNAPSAAVQSGPGILIFSRRQQLLHMNRRALELTGHIKQTEIGAVNDIRLAPVRDLNAQIQEVLDSRKDTDISETLELKRLIFNAGRKILIRGFGLTGRHSSRDGSRIVIVLDEIAPPQEVLSAQPRGLPFQELLPHPLKICTEAF